MKDRNRRKRRDRRDNGGNYRRGRGGEKVEGNKGSGRGGEYRGGRGVELKDRETILSSSFHNHKPYVPSFLIYSPSVASTTATHLLLLSSVSSSLQSW